MLQRFVFSIEKAGNMRGAPRKSHRTYGMPSGGVSVRKRGSHEVTKLKERRYTVFEEPVKEEHPARARGGRGYDFCHRRTRNPDFIQRRQAGGIEFFR